MSHLTTHKQRESSYLRAYKVPDIYVPIRHYICRESSTNQLPFMQNKPNFRKSQMNVSILLQKDYENKSNWTIGQNKPNSNPIKPNCLKTKMDVNSILTKDYERNDIFAVPENKPNSNPIQTQFKPNSNPNKPNFCQNLLCCNSFGFRLLSFSDARPFALEIVSVNSLADKRFEVHPPEFPRLRN